MDTTYTPKLNIKQLTALMELLEAIEIVESALYKCLPDGITEEALNPELPEILLILQQCQVEVHN